MRDRWARLAAAVLFGFLAGRPALAQATTPEAPPEAAPAAPTAEPAMKEPRAYRPIEGPVIINLPSVDVPAKGTLTLFFGHRFQQPVQDSSFNTLFSFDSPANIGIGIGYAPLKDLAFSFYRYSNANTTYQIGAKYGLLTCGAFALTLAAGADIRTAPGLDNRSTFSAQTIFAFTPAPWVRITAVPTYLNHTSGLPSYFVESGVPLNAATLVVRPEPFYANVFNVPLAASVAITHSITLHGEVVPSYGRTVLASQAQPGCTPAPCPATPMHSSPGIGWSVSIEKALLRHRFAFTAGNMRETTTDQYPLPNFAQNLIQNPKNVYLGFNIMRAWSFH